MKKGPMEVEKQVIEEEKVSFTLLLYRKTKAQRWMEIGLFLVGFLVLMYAFQFQLRTTAFVTSLLVWAALVMLLVPGVYRWVNQPRYLLFPHTLCIERKGTVREIDLSQIQPTHDLPYIFDIEGKKTSLLVSDEFLATLRSQLEIVKRGLQ